MSGFRIDAAEFQDRDPGARELTIAMIDGEPVVLLWQARWVDAALSAAADMGLPVAASWGVARELGVEPGDAVGSAEAGLPNRVAISDSEGRVAAMREKKWRVPLALSIPCFLRPRREAWGAVSEANGG